ncbi:hypothetical protein, partial [Klebsiella grimontii]|uniref:hypothetical protein n=1 Tax=Klebsiella grimontii TaxID=2058152 RepID=UPI001D0F125C
LLGSNEFSLLKFIQHFGLGAMNSKIPLNDGHTSKTPRQTLRDRASRKALDLAIHATTFSVAN